MRQFYIPQELRKYLNIIKTRVVTGGGKMIPTTDDIQEGTTNKYYSSALVQSETVGGDLSGTIGSATVSKINGNPLGSTTPTSGNVLVGDGTQWATSTPDSAGLVDKSSNQTIGGDKTFSDNVSIDGTLGVTGATTLSTLNVSSITATGNIESGDKLIGDVLNLKALDTDPPDPPANQCVIWQSDGTDSGDDGDIMVKITDSSGTTKTGTLVDFSAL